jgi:ATP-dependent exoDNAse (exonuclease V) beta subunit
MSGLTTVIADAAERSRAVDPTRSFIVQAPAGSGKTELLIQRFLALLATVARPDEILAITFTRKAAAEMRSRLLQALQSATGQQPDSEHGRRTWNLARAALQQDRKQGWNLAENPSLLTIQTIDSFNASLVRRMPWVSRFGALPEVAEDPETLYRRAAERLLASLGTGKRGDAEVARVLHHLDNRMDLLRDMLVRMLGRRDQWLRHLVWDEHHEQRKCLEKSLADLAEATLAAAHQAIPLHLRDDLLSLGRYAASCLEGADRPLASLTGLKTFPAAGAETLQGWLGLSDLLLTSAGTLRKRLDKNCGFPPGKGEAHVMKARMQEILERLAADPEVERLLEEVRQLPPAIYPEDQWGILQALVELLPLAAAELWVTFQQEGTADFAEIALKARAALGSTDNPSDLLLKLDARLSHILVDEFQDTSYLQFNLLKSLTEGWMPGDGRTLFVVGDPMQSIYLFREAEVGLFLRARSRGIGSVSLEPLTLCSNFRSQQGVVEWVNASFATLFPSRENEALGGVVYAPAAAVHPSLPEAACTVHPFAGRDDAAEAREVTRLVRKSLEEHPEETVAVLVRSRTHLPEILRAFREEGMRYAARDIDILQCRPAVRDILALTRALLHPADRLSWLAVLRAPWCGLLLSDLHALCGSAPSRTIPGLLADPVVLERLSADGARRVERIGQVLRRGMARRGAVGLRRLVEGCWLALGGPACVGEGEGKDIDAVFALLERLDHGGDLQSLDALEECVRKLFAEPDAGADGRLQVMTIHKSKGLEFDTVILPGLGRSPAGGDQPLLRWLEHPDSGLLLAPLSPKDGSFKDPIYTAIGRLEREKEDLEVTRLLYVAATRARKRLHLFGHARINGQGECQPAAGSLLKKLWPVVETRFAGADASGPEAIADAADRGGNAIRRLPAEWRLPELTPAPVRCAAAVNQPSEKKEGDLHGEFTGWEAETARHAGTVTHAYLERIAREGLEAWPVERIRAEEGEIRRRLNALGIPSGELAEGGARVVRALKTTLDGPRGRWLLSPHPEAACELGLSGVIQGRLVRGAVDRTFVENGTRWIIDYKTSEPLGMGLETFFDQEAQRYRDQLAAYRTLFRQMEEERVVRAALYFPLVDGWCELPVE